MARFTCSMIASMMLLWVFSCSLGSSLSPSDSYKNYCKDILMDAHKEPPQQDNPPASTPSIFSLGLHRSFFSGGSPLFNTNSTTFSVRWPENSADFTASSVKPAPEKEAQTYVVEGSILLQDRSRLRSGKSIRVFHRGGGRETPDLWDGAVRLTTKGLWVARSGTLCMAGCFAQNGLGQAKPRDDCQVKAVFHYPLKNSISQPLVKGMIESMREHEDPLFFEPVVITAVSAAPYVFRKDIEDAENWPPQQANVPKNIKIWKDEAAVCQYSWYMERMSVMWDKQCTGQDCSPFRNMIPGSPTTLSVENMACKDDKVHGLFIFNHESTLLQTVSDVFAVEGAWNPSAGQFGASACYLKGAASESMALDSQDCDIQITLQFPATLTLLFRYSVVGRVERKKSSLFPTFKPFLFAKNMDGSLEFWGEESSPRLLEYAYTEETIRRVQNQCKASSPKHSKKGWRGKGNSTYPDGKYFSDFRFHATLKDSSGSSVKAYFFPVEINSRNKYFDSSVGVATSEAISKKISESMNVSFAILLYSKETGIKLLQNTTVPSQFPAEGVYNQRVFPAEGVYNQRTGMLCLSACRPLKASQVQIGSKPDDDTDCEVLFTVQYPPINPGFYEKHEISGEVTSLREQKDILYFAPATVSSASIFYREQVAAAVEQIDFEFIMVIISLTMAALFIGIQLRHAKKNPKVLTQMSLLMLTVLTLGHLIPLVLNFEAISSSRFKQTVLAWRGGWLALNEVMIRLMTMLAFLMLIRLFYLSWVSKNEASSSEGPWQMERGSVGVCLSLYALGGLVALTVYGIKGSSFLDVTKACAGLMVDFFLFPQVVGNYIWEIQGSILSSPFYIGMTLVRSLPHLYDVLRKHGAISLRGRAYLYAHPSWDFYSTVWDAIIPVGNLLLALVILLQQRYGGACLSVASWRKSKSYTQVSTNTI